MTKINFNQVPEQNNPQQSNTPRKLKPGVHLVTITGVTASPEDSLSKPFITIGFVAEDGSYLNYNSYTTEKAVQWTALKLKNMFKALSLEVPEEMTIDQINSSLTGKKGYLKVSGEEVMIPDNDNPGREKKIVSPVLDGFNFFVSDANPAGLTFDSSTDIKKLLSEKASESAENSEKTDDDLPF